MAENKTDLFTRATEAAREVKRLSDQISQYRAALKTAKATAAKLRKGVIEAMGPAKVRTRKKKAREPAMCEHGTPLVMACGHCMALARLAQEREANGE